MSIEATRAVIRERGLSTSKRAILFSFANQADNAGYSWLGIGTVADDVELDPRHTRRLCIELVAEGRLDVVYKGGGRGRTTLYRVLPAVLEDDEHGTSRVNYERRFAVVEKGDNLTPFSSPQRGTPARVKGDAGARKQGRGDPPTLHDTKMTRDDVSLSLAETELDVVPEIPARETGETMADWIIRISELHDRPVDAS